MADNRMYIRCESCGKMLFLGKRLGFGYYWWNYGKDNNEANRGKPWYKEQDERPLEDRLNEFFANHTWCGGEQDNFRIVYETDDDFEYKGEQ